MSAVAKAASATQARSQDALRYRAPCARGASDRLALDLAPGGERVGDHLPDLLRGLADEHLCDPCGAELEQAGAIDKVRRVGEAEELAQVLRHLVHQRGVVAEDRLLLGEGPRKRPGHHRELEIRQVLARGLRLTARKPHDELQRLEVHLRQRNLRRLLLRILILVGHGLHDLHEARHGPGDGDPAALAGARHHRHRLRQRSRRGACPDRLGLLCVVHLVPCRHPRGGGLCGPPRGVGGEREGEEGDDPERRADHGRRHRGTHRAAPRRRRSVDPATPLPLDD
mmetsp:Transcript_22011/g.62565  ORF Transcript_22011/g.62565 Transcript_22011/m.62565 type:complete len:283 (-) Transcript_22011:25-873(-)